MLVPVQYRGFRNTQLSFLANGMDGYRWRKLTTSLVGAARVVDIVKRIVIRGRNMLLIEGNFWYSQIRCNMKRQKRW
jgi:hypothetical protein